MMSGRGLPEVDLQLTRSRGRDGGIELLLLCQKMLHDFPAGGAPYTFMRAHVLERRVKRADTMWLAGDERVHAMAMTRGTAATPGRPTGMRSVSCRRRSYGGLLPISVSIA